MIYKTTWLDDNGQEYTRYTSWSGNFVVLGYDGKYESIVNLEYGKFWHSTKPITPCKSELTNVRWYVQDYNGHTCLYYRDHRFLYVNFSDYEGYVPTVVLRHYKYVERFLLESQFCINDEVSEYQVVEPMPWDIDESCQNIQNFMLIFGMYIKS